MASCTQVEQLNQAYIDGQLGSREKVIVEQHMAECGACRSSFRRHQSVSALLFESFADRRLTRDLTQSVLENLPELDTVPMDVAEVNWRAKHPGGSWRRWVARSAVAAVLLVLVFSFAVIRQYTDTEVKPYDAIGVVTHVAGAPSYLDLRSNDIGRAVVSEYITPEQRFETNGDSILMLTLAGPTNIKLNHNTSVVVHSAREITIDRGEAFFDVEKNQGLFHVVSPTGVIEVTGTQFDVQASSQSAKVVLLEGEVTVEHHEFASSFMQLRPDQEVSVLRAESVLQRKKTDAKAVSSWSFTIDADPDAYQLFEDQIMSQYGTLANTIDRDEDVIRLGGQDLKGTVIESLTLTWEPSQTAWGHCGYLVNVKSDNGSLVFRGVIRGEDIQGSTNNSFTISNPNGRIIDTSGANLSLIPDRRQGSAETKFSQFTGVTRSSTAQR